MDARPDVCERRASLVSSRDSRVVPPATLLPGPFPLLGTAPATPTGPKALYKRTLPARRMLLPCSQGQPWPRGSHSPPGPSPPPRSHWKGPLSRLLIWETEALRAPRTLRVRFAFSAAPKAGEPPGRPRSCRKAVTPGTLPAAPAPLGTSWQWRCWVGTFSPPSPAFPLFPFQLITQTHASLWAMANDWPN